MKWQRINKVGLIFSASLVTVGVIANQTQFISIGIVGSLLSSIFLVSIILRAYLHK